MFQLITLLKPDFFEARLSYVDKVTTEKCSFVLVISNVPIPEELVITQVDDHVKIKLTLQLIKGISRVLQKLLRYFNGTIISTSFSLPGAEVFPVIFILDLNNFKFSKLSFGLSL